jgi:hypothetical protein
VATHGDLTVYDMMARHFSFCAYNTLYRDGQLPGDASK